MPQEEVENERPIVLECGSSEAWIAGTSPAMTCHFFRPPVSCHTYGLDVATNPVHFHDFVKGGGGGLHNGPRVPRALVFVFALALLFETWIWNRVVVAVRRLVALVPWTALNAALARLIDRLPVWAALLMFGIPFVVAETGAFVCVVIAATGHIVVGGVGYVVVKVVGFGLVVPIFDLTREKLLTMPWFAFIYEKFLAFHEFAERLVAPYREAAAAYVNGLRARARAYWQRRVVGAEEEIG